MDDQADGEGADAKGTEYRPEGVPHYSLCLRRLLQAEYLGLCLSVSIPEGSGDQAHKGQTSSR